MKKVFISLLCLLFISSTYGCVYAASGQGFRDIFVGIFSRTFSSGKDKNGGDILDSYADELRKDIEVEANVFKNLGKENDEELIGILRERTKTLNNRRDESCVKRTCKDVGSNLHDCPDACDSCCYGCWDCLKGFFGCCCCPKCYSKCCSNRRKHHRDNSDEQQPLL